MDAIKVLWKEVQMMDATKTPTGAPGSSDPDRPRPSGSFGSKISSRSSEHSIAKLMETLEATAGGGGGGAKESSTEGAASEMSKSEHHLQQQQQRQSDSAVMKLSETCANLQSQVEQLQSSLTGVVRFMSSFASASDSNLHLRRDSDSTSTCTQDTASFHYFGPASIGGGAMRPEDHGAGGGGGKPMFASLDPSTFVLANQNEPAAQQQQSQQQQQQSSESGVLMSKSCDSLVQTDISAVLTPKADGSSTAVGSGAHPFLHLRAVDIPLGEGSGETSTDEGGGHKDRSPRPSTLPGLNEGDLATRRGVPGLRALAGKAVLDSPQAPPEVKTFAKTMVEGLLTDVSKEQQQQQQADETDVSLSLVQDEEVGTAASEQQQQQQPTVVSSPPPTEEVSQSSHMETDSLDESHNSPKVSKRANVVQRR